MLGILHKQFRDFHRCKINRLTKLTNINFIIWTLTDNTYRFMRTYNIIHILLSSFWAIAYFFGMLAYFFCSVFVRKVCDFGIDFFIFYFVLWILGKVLTWRLITML